MVPKEPRNVVLAQSGPVAAGALSWSDPPYDGVAPGYWFLAGVTTRAAMHAGTGPGYRHLCRKDNGLRLRRPVVPGRMTRDIATNSTFKDRVPLAGKGFVGRIPRLVAADVMNHNDACLVSTLVDSQL